ncbi:glycosyltransferase [Sphingomonas pokkalii]|uniref:Glycosyltransferase n=1 Tax=Sphingomonas pokkalii TaxID=2175090 RepID=A0A2U0SDS3_9SPHN|nr:glycosyltransferase [Sphingomonas pokkalii]PVX29532.1 glycosyltransferase [Sphingomonas pokkalii]
MRVVLATIGSLGDLHPFIAIGRVLRAAGQAVVLAVPEDHVTKVRAAGLEAAAILPSYAAICERLGMREEEVAARVLADSGFVLDEILLPSLPASTAALDAVADGADVLVGSIFALAAEIVAEKRGLPLATIVLQPMTLFSAWQPPAAPRFEAMRHSPRTMLGRSWNRALYAVVRTILRRRHARHIDAVRAQHRLAPRRGAPLLDHGCATRAVLCCWSSALGGLPPDAPQDARLVGFPFFDSESGADAPLAPELDAFLRAGPPPLVFTLGSFAVASAGHFYDEAAAAARRLGMRAVLLTGRPGPPKAEGDCLYLHYAPHSAVFPRAAAVIHHGGVGTTGQALRAGRPQIVVPHFGDQFDNAVRLERAGIGQTIRRERFESRVVAEAIARLLSKQAVRAAASRAAAHIAAEDGAVAAAGHIQALCA